ncbi:hypothetical protein [Petrachloros mirabilis]
MKTHARYLWLFVAIGFLSTLIPFTDILAETVQRTVRGTVIATNVTVEPQIIVLRVMLPNKEEMIVGARVPTDTDITRGKQPAGLGDIKVGESAVVTYVKSPDGLTTKAIHLR